jgi:hypothetical protein
MMARGGFDPKIEVDFSKKQFKDTEYYSILNSSFKIPTWYGIEIKADLTTTKVYLNPENTVPNQGLTSLGVTVPLGQGSSTSVWLMHAKCKMQLSQNENFKQLLFCMMLR